MLGFIYRVYLSPVRRTRNDKAFFDKMLYFPYPDASRYMLWKQTIAEQLKGSPVNREIYRR